LQLFSLLSVLAVLRWSLGESTNDKFLGGMGGSIRAPVGSFVVVCVQNAVAPNIAS
jgi:hypothetical protein